MNSLTIQIGNMKRVLPLIKGEGVSYYFFNMLGDVELNKESAKALAKKVIKDSDVIVTIETKAIALVEELSKLLNQPRYVVVRKNKKAYMSNEVTVQGKTIISGEVDYYIDGHDIEYLKGKRVIVIDDVISTCGTIDAVYRILEKSNIKILQFGCVLTEGERRKEYRDIPLISLDHIPLIKNN